MITAFDATALKQSVTLSYPFTTSIDAGTVTVCDDLTELVDIEAVGEPQHAFFISRKSISREILPRCIHRIVLMASYFYVNSSWNYGRQHIQARNLRLDLHFRMETRLVPMQ
jgi:hypothetical protein